MKTIKNYVLGAIFVLLLGSCADHLRVKGNGIPAVDMRDLPAFTGIVSGGTFDVHITYGTEQEVIVNSEENLIPHIETSVRGNKLYIGITANQLQPSLPMEVYITIPELKEVELSGSGEITSGYFETDILELALSGSGNMHIASDAEDLYGLISGSGNLKISGEASESHLRISGSGNILASTLESQNCYALISGSGDIHVTVTDYLEGRITGSGNVIYSGAPQVDSYISGSGRIIRN